MGNEECKNSDENAWNHIEVNIVTIAQQQNTDHSTDKAHRQFA